VRQKTAALIAFVTVPVVPTLVNGILTPRGRYFDWVTMLVFALISYFICMAVAVLLGGPIFLALSRINLVRWWSALAAGFLVGAIVAVLVRLQSAVHVQEVLLLGFEGALCGIVFWVIWKQGREPESAVSNEARHEI
jgi:hypothetical protein